MTGVISINGVECKKAVNFNASKDAFMQIANLTANTNLETMMFLRIMVDVGGCAGMRYHMLLDDYVTENDFALTDESESDLTKSIVIIDEYSMEYLKDGYLEYEETLEGANFKIINPNATASCSCGSSFGCGA